VSEVGVSLTVTKSSREIPGGTAMVEKMLNVSIARKFPGVTDVEIVWLWDDTCPTVDGEEIPPYWVAMATGQLA
jgi:hypothetical protein